MKYWLYLFFYLGLSFPVTAQQVRFRKETPPPPPTAKLRNTDLHCQPLRRYPLQKRLLAYPFNKATSVALLSFHSKGSVLRPADSTDMRNYFYDYCAVPERQEDSATVIREKIVLDSLQLDKLTALLYHQGYKRQPVILPATTSGCYAPHNAIAFYNWEGEIFAFIELCFTCGGMRLSDDNIDTGDLCNEKQALLKSFFRDNGILIGISYTPMIPWIEPELKK